MTTFSHIFRSTRDLAISQGRRPVVCLLGPDMQKRFHSFLCDGLQHYPNIITGIHIRHMRIPGLALLTAPAPESGFDTTN